VDRVLVLQGAQRVVVSDTPYSTFDLSDWVPEQPSATSDTEHPAQGPLMDLFDRYFRNSLEVK
jgi:hypothetical protein